MELKSCQEEYMELRLKCFEYVNSTFEINVDLGNANYIDEINILYETVNIFNKETEDYIEDVPISVFSEEILRKITFALEYTIMTSPNLEKLDNV